MTHISYNKNLKTFSRQLRNNSTFGEILLWKRLNKRQCCGKQFNRQKPLGKYIVDFYCKSAGLVIEIDGYSHTFESVRKNDIARQKELEGMGLTVLRFTEADVRNNIEDVIQVIVTFLERQSPYPPFQGGTV